MLPEPDGTVGQLDRQHMALVYAGIAATVAVVVVSNMFVPEIIGESPDFVPAGFSDSPDFVPASTAVGTSFVPE